MSGDNNGWGEYSKMVLKELEVLAQGINALKVDMEGLKREMTELRAKEDRVKELVEWKRRVDDVASPVQLRDLQKEVARLQDFKVKATTAFVAAQMVVAAAFALLKLF
tara:strand:+ start:297 stop:620 length:324 start_codon:yes stop_codon:yes gene_type:complete